MSIKSLEVSQIRRDIDLQPRVNMNQSKIDEYAADIADGKEFDPIEVLTNGEYYFCWDGFHRLYAHEKAGKTHINAVVERGTRRDAIKLSLGANAKHGMQRTNEDKRKAVATALSDEEWVHYSNREIAEMCGVSDVFVASVRSQVQTVCTSDEPERRIGKDGKSYPASKPKKPKANESNGKPAADGAGGQEGKAATSGIPASAPSKAAKESIEAEVDRYKVPIPKELRGIFLGSPSHPEPWKTINNLLNQIRDILVSVRDEPASHYLRRSNEYTQDGKSLRLLEQFRDLVDLKRPWSLCPACKGKGCEFCDRIGWVDRMQHNTAKQGMSVNV